MNRMLEMAPELQVATWLNSDKDLSLSELKGSVVAIYVFQMLCPGCVHHSIPQLKKLQQIFNSENIQILGMHSVFEHHDANSKETLKAFLYENKINLPVAIDAAGEGTPIPKTMETYRLQGTPSLILIDKQGYLRKVHFGHVDDLVLGAEIMALIKE